MREMTVYGVSFDLVGKQPIVLLRTQEGNTFLPIWIGHPEAAAILMSLQGTEPQRPMTHDLATSIVASLDAEIRQIAVTELRENTFHARITIVRNGTEVELDARTSDAIALALRCDAKIFAADDVIEESGVEFEGDEEEASRRLIGQDSLADLDPDEFRRFLDTVSPDEFAAEPDEESDARRRDVDPPTVSRRRAPSSSDRGDPSPAGRDPPRRAGPCSPRPARRAAAARDRGRRCRARAAALSSQSSVTSSSRWLTAATIALVVLGDLGPDLVEALAHSATAATRAAALKIPCTTMPG